jgi:hypothetical protein
VKKPTKALSMSLRVENLKSNRRTRYKVLGIWSIIAALIAIDVVCRQFRTPPVIKQLRENRKYMEETWQKMGYTNYGNDTWGAPIIDRSMTNAVKRN